jgi:galactose mutarotase-like enzyme
VSRFAVGGREILFMDAATLADPAKNVRGGIPVLFPSPGKLSGVPYAMNQHGFARELPWSVVTENPSSITLELTDTGATRALFPFEFRLAFSFSVEGASLAIRQRYENRSKEKMPFAAGFHPYFLVPDAEKARATISTRATRAFDNVTKEEVAFSGFDLTRPEVDLHLLDHGEARSVLTRPDGRGAVEIAASPEFRRWVVWTLAGKDFVCVEPWTAPANALNTGEGLLRVAPGEARELWVTLTAIS